MTEFRIPYPPPEPSFLEAPPTLRGYQPVERVDSGDGSRTFFAVHEETRAQAALKLIGSSCDGHDVYRPGRYTNPDHPRIARILDDGYREGTSYLIREWAPGVPFSQLLSNPPGRENTRRLCRALLDVTVVIDWMHTDGGTVEYIQETGGEWERPRVHGNLNARNVIVDPSGRAMLINCEASWPVDLLHMNSRGHDLHDPLGSDLRAVLHLFDSIWTSFETDVVPIDAAVPTAVAALRRRSYTSIHDFRSDLTEALSEYLTTRS